MFVSSLCLLFGALLVGDALHGGIVTNQYAITSPAAVFRLLFGVVAIGLGYRLRVHPDDRMIGSRTADSETNTDDEAAFDRDDSPFDETSLERLAEREREREDDQ